MNANTLTIRDASGKVIGTPRVGSLAMTWKARTATVGSLMSTMIQGWIYGQLERIAAAGGDQAAFRNQVVTVADEYRY